MSADAMVAKGPNQDESSSNLTCFGQDTDFGRAQESDLESADLRGKPQILGS